MDKRHDRTSILIEDYISNVDNFFSIPIAITGDQKLLESLNGQIMLETIVNIVCRFTDTIILELTDSPLISRLKKTILGVGCKIKESNENYPEIVISIGNTNFKGKFNINVNSSGWVSYVSCNSNVKVFQNSFQNPIGAMGSACFASAEAFKRLLEINGCEQKWTKNHLENIHFSFLDNSFSESNAIFPQKIDFNKILLVGAGAVGSGFIFAISKLINSNGIIHVLDPDCVDETNLNRCLTYFKEDVNKKKAKIVERYSTNTLKIIGNYMHFSNLKKERKEFPIVISTVDNNEARHEIQYDLPKVIFHGATGKSASAISIIKFLENACMCCIFESNVSQEEIISSEMGIPLDKVKDAINQKLLFSKEHFDYMKDKLSDQTDKFENLIGMPFEDVYRKEVCGTINLSTKLGKKEASIPFVSFFSGLMLLSELIKYHTSELHQFPMINVPDFLQINLFSPMSYNLSRRVKNSNCLLDCSNNIIQKIYSEKWGLNIA